MWWTRLRSACWCMLMYAAARKPSPPKGRNFPVMAEGDTEHRHSLHCSVHQNQTAIRMPFPVELGQSADVGPSSILQSPYEKLDLGPCDKRANKVVRGCFSASFLVGDLSLSTLREYMRWEKQLWISLLILAEIGFYFETKWLLQLLVYRQRQSEQSILWMFRSVCHHGDGPQSCEAAAVSAN